MRVGFFKRWKIRMLLKNFDVSYGFYSSGYTKEEALREVNRIAHRAIIRAEYEIIGMTTSLNPRNHFFTRNESDFRLQNDRIMYDLIPKLVEEKDTINEMCDGINKAFRWNVKKHFLLH